MEPDHDIVFCSMIPDELLEEMAEENSESREIIEQTIQAKRDLEAAESTIKSNQG